MTRTDVTGQTCVGDLRLAPLDVGFDLRRSGHTVRLPDWEWQSVGLEQDGRVWLVAGTIEEMVAAIRAAGYTIAE